MPTGAPASLPVSRFRVAWIVVAFLATTFVHAVVGRGTHGLHVIHVVFGALYLVPIVASAVWVGARPAMVLALGSAVAYLVHVRTSWAGQPTENANQLAFAAVYVFVGVAQRVLRPRLHNVKADTERRGARIASRAVGLKGGRASRRTTPRVRGEAKSYPFVPLTSNPSKST